MGQIGGQRLESSVFQDFPGFSCSFVVLDVHFRGSDRGQRLRSSVFHYFSWFFCSFVGQIGGQRLRSSVFQDFPWISCSFVVLDLQFRGSDRGQRLRSSVFHDFTWFSCSFVWVRSGVRGSDPQFSKIFVGFTAVLWFWSCSFVGQIGLRRPEFAHLWAFFSCFSEPEGRNLHTSARFLVFFRA